RSRAEDPESDWDVLVAHHPDSGGRLRRVRCGPRASAYGFRLAGSVCPHSHPDAGRVCRGLHRLSMGPRETQDPIRCVDFHRRLVHRGGEADLRPPVITSDRTRTRFGSAAGAEARPSTRTLLRVLEGHLIADDADDEGNDHHRVDTWDDVNGCD